MALSYDNKTVGSSRIDSPGEKPKARFVIGSTFPEEKALEYRKHKAVKLVHMDVDFTCASREGMLEGKAGDYLAQDGHGGFYPISAEFHAEHYELVE